MTRTSTIVLAWLVAVVGATVIGLLAVGAIGDGIVGPGPRPLSAGEVDALLASSTPVPTVSTRPSPPVGVAPEVLASAGGTVVARCAGGVVQIVSASPAQGYRLHDEGGEDPGRVRFDSDRGRVEMRLSCSGGHPVSQVRTDG